MQLTHVDISVPVGMLDDDFIKGLEQLVCGVFGWTGGARGVRQPGSGATLSASYQTGTVTLTVREADNALRPGSEDHLGFVVDADELSRLAMACSELAAR